MAIQPLSFAASSEQIQSNHRQFVSHAKAHADVVLDLFRRGKYFLYQPADSTFSPAKFVGFADMTFSRYAQCRSGNPGGAKFDGHQTQQQIQQVLQPQTWVKSPKLAAELERLLVGQFGSTALEGISNPAEKWRFLTLPAPNAGLAGLAGGWEDSEEFVEVTLSIRRGTTRRKPSLDE